MKNKYLLSSDNGYHWNTYIMFDSIEDAVIYHVNERIDEYSDDWKEISIKDITRPLKNYQAYIVVDLVVFDSDGYENQETIYISEMTEIKPENKYNVIFKCYESKTR